MVEQIVDTYWGRDERVRNLIGKFYKVPIKRIERHKVNEFRVLYNHELSHINDMTYSVDTRWKSCCIALTNIKGDAVLPMFEAYWGEGFNDVPGMAHVGIDWPFTVEGVAMAYRHEVRIKNQTEEELDGLKRWWHKFLEEI